MLFIYKFEAKILRPPKAKIFSCSTEYSDVVNLELDCKLSIHTLLTQDTQH